MNTNSLDDIDDLKSLCARFGLTLSGAEVQGELLQLVPQSLEGLPDAARLRQLAIELAPLGYRYVTLALAQLPKEQQ
ncbi:MAG: hypothetical protein H0U74_22175 [Bradymonadaceae bacterium]|nr:hypothetical protein [Lujinxingiaceae bacterium]